MVTREQQVLENKFWHRLNQILNDPKQIDAATLESRFILKDHKPVAISKVASDFNAEGGIDWTYHAQITLDTSSCRFERMTMGTKIVLTACIEKVAKELGNNQVIEDLKRQIYKSLEFQFWYSYSAFNFPKLQPVNALKTVLQRKMFQFPGTNIFIGPGPNPPFRISERDPLNMVDDSVTFSGFVDGLAQNGITDVIAIGQPYAYHPRSRLEKKDPNRLATPDFFNYFIPDETGTVTVQDTNGLTHTINSKPIKKVGRIVTYAIQIDDSKKTILIHHYPLSDMLPLNLTPDELHYVQSIGKKSGQVLTHCASGKGRSAQVAYILASSKSKYKSMSPVKRLAQMRLERTDDENSNHFVATEQQQNYLQDLEADLQRNVENYKEASASELQQYVVMLRLIKTQLAKYKANIEFPRSEDSNGIARITVKTVAGSSETEKKHIKLLDLYKDIQTSNTLEEASKLFNDRLLSELSPEGFENLIFSIEDFLDIHPIDRMRYITNLTTSYMKKFDLTHVDFGKQLLVIEEKLKDEPDDEERKKRLVAAHAQLTRQAQKFVEARENSILFVEKLLSGIMVNIESLLFKGENIPVSLISKADQLIQALSELQQYFPVLCGTVQKDSPKIPIKDGKTEVGVETVSVKFCENSEREKHRKNFQIYKDYIAYLRFKISDVSLSRSKIIKQKKPKGIILQNAMDSKEGELQTQLLNQALNLTNLPKKSMKELFNTFVNAETLANYKEQQAQIAANIAMLSAQRREAKQREIEAREVVPVPKQPEAPDFTTGIDRVHEMLFDIKVGAKYLDPAKIDKALKLISDYIDNLIEKKVDIDTPSATLEELAKLQILCSRDVLFKKDSPETLDINKREIKTAFTKNESRKKRMVFYNSIDTEAEAKIFLDIAEMYLKSEQMRNNVIEKQLKIINLARKTGEYVAAKAEFHRLGETRWKAFWATKRVNNYFALFQPGSSADRTGRESNMERTFNARLKAR